LTHYLIGLAKMSTQWQFFYHDREIQMYYYINQMCFSTILVFYPSLCLSFIDPI